VRILILLLSLACLFGLAALWHFDRVASARASQQEARRIAQGQAARTEAGVIPDGFGVLLVGKAAGAEPAPNARPQAPRPQIERASTPPPPQVEPAVEPAVEADFELVVQSGQTLSKIARSRYGTASASVVDALARYNGLADADALRAGQTLKLPSAQKLDALAKSR
jgi:nucleoid-associated protein YgaU